MSPKDIHISDYDYPLPNERIAKFPLPQRDHSKLLISHNGQIQESQFFHLPEFLDPETLLVFNDTKVIHARLFFQKPTGSVIEVFCLEPWHTPITQAFEATERCQWLCFIGNNKKWKSEPLAHTLTVNGQPCTLTAERQESVGNAWVVTFHWTGGYDFATLLEQVGVIPLPPYLHREAESSDNERYQTVYALHQGSVAAPTAGLHFTESVFNELRDKGITTEFITLDVGAGTFKPVNTATIGEHQMHTEKIHITRSNIQRLIQQFGKPIIPVGTTTVRTLESVYWFGVKLNLDPTLQQMEVEQWDPYELSDKKTTPLQSYQAVLQWMERNGIELLEGDTRLLIAPGYTYQIITGLITNFHQPKSTLLLLVSALVGNHWKACYQYALDHDFRFLSYGDSCLFN